MNRWGEWRNESSAHLANAKRPTGYWHPRLYEFTASLEWPLTYIDACECSWQPDRHFLTDMGSIPRIVQGLPGLGKDDRLCSYLLHDSAYVHGGLWRSPCTTFGYSFHALTKAEADRLLYYMLRAEGGGWLAAQAIYRAVRLASPVVHYGPKQ